MTRRSQKSPLTGRHLLVATTTECRDNRKSPNTQVTVTGQSQKPEHNNYLRKTIAKVRHKIFSALARTIAKA